MQDLPGIHRLVKLTVNEDFLAVEQMKHTALTFNFLAMRLDKPAYIVIS